MQEPECPKCSQIMEEGFILDHDRLSGHTQAEWIEGPPIRSIWTGLKLKGKVHRTIATYCCPDCGYLESYAQVIPAE